MMRGWMVFDGAQDLGQLGRAEFAGSAGPVAVSGETSFGHATDCIRSRPESVPGPQFRYSPCVNNLADFP